MASGTRSRTPRAPRVNYDVLDNTGQVVTKNMEGNIANKEVSDGLTVENLNESADEQKDQHDRSGPVHMHSLGSPGSSVPAGLVGSPDRDDVGAPVGVFRSSVGVAVAGVDRGSHGGEPGGRLYRAQEEHKALLGQAQQLAMEAEVEVQERANIALRKKIADLVNRRKEAQLGSPVLVEEVLQGVPALQSLHNTLQMLDSEANARQESDKQQALKHAKQKEMEEKEQYQAHLQAEARKRSQDIQRQQERHAKAMQDLQEQFEMELRAQKDQLAREMREQLEAIRVQQDSNLTALHAQRSGPGGTHRSTLLSKYGRPELLDPDLDLQVVEQVLQWQEASQQSKVDGRKETRHDTLAAMMDSTNTFVCPQSGVNKLKNLELIDNPDTLDLTKKTQKAIAAAMSNLREEDTDGECFKKRKLQSGLELKSSHKVRTEVEWAQHNLGREFEANPISIGQMKFEHYVLGEINIIAECRNVVEVEKRVSMLAKITYWRLKYDWPLARNIYVAALRDVEVGRRSWEDFDVLSYKEMLEGNRISGGGPREDQQKRRYRDTWFCAAYQKNECKQDPPHMARVGQEDRLVQHICSSCWLKEGKKLNHPNGGGGCPRAKP